LFQITVGMQTERVDRNRAMSSLGVSKVWYLYRLSTRTNQRAVYFFCQKYYKPRNSAETLFTEKTLFTGIRQNSTIHQSFGYSVSSTSKTEIPRNSVKHYSPKERINRKPRKREFWINEL